MYPNMLQQLPFNISLLALTGQNLQGMREVKALDIFEGGSDVFEARSKNFHPDGLFSVETFGKVGDERRNRLFGFIDLKVPVFHPVIFKALLDLKELYGQIMSGSAYAVFDPKLKDFIPATITTGHTGFAFFMKHFQELRFEERKSTSREFNIKLVYQERERDATMNKLLVMPAGLRDFTIDPNGKPEEDEVNTIYRRILSISSMLQNVNVRGDLEYLDNTRFQLQLQVRELYNYIVSLLEGKHKLIQGWWTNRNIFNSTRNVITSNVPRSERLGDPLTISPNHTVVGLYQTLRAIFPLAINLVRNFTLQSFPGPTSPAILVNKKTLSKEMVQVSSEHYDDWVSQEGLEAGIGRFEIEGLRHDPVEVDGRYLGLIYNDGKYVKFLQGKEELPEGKDPKYLNPITYAELFYLAVAERAKKTPCFVTRYPVIGLGGIYPSYIYLKTTVRSQCLTLLDDLWNPSDTILNEWPIEGEAFVNSMSPSAQHLARLGADFDGDMCSLIALMTDESDEEIRVMLDSANFYVGVDGKMNFSSSNDISDLIFSEMSS